MFHLLARQVVGYSKFVLLLDNLSLKHAIFVEIGIDDMNITLIKKISDIRGIMVVLRCPVVISQDMLLNVSLDFHCYIRTNSRVKFSV